jgi:dCTP deaminase
MSANPWDKWLPGVLSDQQAQSLLQQQLITLGSSDKISAASVDLSVSDKAFKMPQGSIKPSKANPYNHVLTEPLPLRDGYFDLEKRHTYVFQLVGELNPRIRETSIYGQATAKSSVGRLDVLARLIVDGMDTYECFQPKDISTGRLYVEVTPITFNIRVRPGSSFTQLRLFYGDPEDSIISGNEICRAVLEGDSRVLTLDLEPVDIGGHRVSAFCAKDFVDDPITLDKKNVEDPKRFWEFAPLDSHKRLQIKNGRFYILRSKEKLWVPKGVAIYCKASDETIGEMRIHYAGFAHPGFGSDAEDNIVRTPLIFEVRGHQVDANLMDGEKMANIVLYRMSDYPEKLDHAYSRQSLKLSNIFKDWT